MKNIPKQSVDNKQFLFLQNTLIKKEKPDLRPAFLIWILKFVMKLRSFCLCFWALLPDGKRAIRSLRLKT